ncbi:M13 family metallopeptidase [Bacteroidota bacterium]
MEAKILLKRLFLFVVFAVVSCTNNSKDNKGSEQLTSGIIIENMDTLVNPGDNFTKYVNGIWVKNTKIPEDKSSYGTFSILRENSQEDVKEIIKESASGNFTKGSDEQKVGDMYKSYMDIEARNKLGITPLKEEFSKIDRINGYDDLAAYFAYANKYGYNVPFMLTFLPDFKNPTINTIYIDQAGLGLPGKEYYLKKDDRSVEIRNKYVEHIDKMIALAELPDSKNSAQLIMALETNLAKEHLNKEQTRDLASLYNMFPVDTLSNIMPGFNWSAFLEDAGLLNQEKLGVLMLDYIKSLDNIITSTEIDTWKTYLKWGVLNANASRLNEAIEKEHFNFFNMELNGMQQQLPLWHRSVSIVNGALGELVGKVYIKKHFTPEAKESMEKLVVNLLKAYEVSIKELDWMSDETINEALDKLGKFNYKIGYPDKWKEYDLEIKADDLFGNLKRSSLMEHNRELAKLSQPIDKEEWFATPQTVNAFYDPWFNEVVFPAAILQPPFFDMQADDAVNYGAIGAIIGHEISHGFDDSGSAFDGEGALRNWWTDKDKEEYKNRTASLVEQYNKFEVLPGLYVNGEYTLGENIGDLGGLSIALKAYKISLGEKEAPVIDGFTGEQRFFIGWAQVWCGKSRKEALQVQVATNPHTPGDFRVNGVVRNIPEFYSAFNIAESDSLYLDLEKRVKIW